MSLFPAYQTVIGKNPVAISDEGDNKNCDSKSSNTSNAEEKLWTRNESYNLQSINLHTDSKETTKSSFVGTIQNSNSLCPDDLSSSSSSFGPNSSKLDSKHASSSDERYNLEQKSKNKKHSKRNRERKGCNFSDSRSRSRSRSQNKRESKSTSRSRSPFYLKKKSDNKKKKSKHEKHKKHKDKHDSKKHKIPQFIPYKTFLEDFNIKDENELRFAEDRHGDKNLSSCKTLPERKTAKYHHRWKTDANVLGKFRISNLQIYRKAGKRIPRFYHKDSMKRFSNSGPENTLDLASKLNSNKNPESVLLRKNYLEFVDDSKYIEELLEDGELAEDQSNAKDGYSSSLVTIELNEIYTKTKEFNAMLRDTPNNEQLWLDYVAFQDIALGNNDFTSSNVQDGIEGEVKINKKTEKARNVILRNKAVIEKKLSILKTASEKNPRSILLAVERLKHSKELYDNATLDRQWKELIFMFPRNVEVWKYYLSFSASHFTNFSVNKMGKSYKNFFLKLKQMHGQGNKNFSESSQQNDDQISTLQIEDEIVNNTIKVANLWTRAGYREKSIALFQATIEINLFSPNFPGSYSLEDRLATFEPFWESGIARFGEDGALGFSTITENKRKNNICDTEMTESCNDPNNDLWEDQLIQQHILTKSHAENLIQSDEENEIDYDKKSGEPGLWLRLELERERRHWLPWRSQEEEAEDADRTVSFEDIQDYLFQFPTPSFSTNSGPLFNLILCFLRHFGIELAEKQLDIFGVLSTQTLGLKLGFNSPENIIVDEKCLIGGTIQNVSPSYIVDASLETFIRNVFKTLSKTIKEPFKTQMIILWLRFEKDLAAAHLESCLQAGKVKVDKKSKSKLIKKEVKDILDQDRENIDVYCGYADYIFALEGYKNSWKILRMILVTKTQDGNVMKNKVLSKIYIYAIINELKEVKRIQPLKNEDTTYQLAIKCHLDHAQWLLILAADNAVYKEHTYVEKHEMPELAERSRQKNSDWIHNYLAAGIDFIVHGPGGSNDKADTMPVIYYNEFTTRVFIHVWLLYFESSGTDDSDQFIDFIIKKLQQMMNSHKFGGLEYVLEVLYKIKIDLLIYEGSTKSIQKCRTALVAAYKEFPCNAYLLQIGILSDACKIQANVSSHFWRSLTTSLTRHKTPCQSYVISILVRFLLNKFLVYEQNKDATSVPFDFKSVTENESVSIGHLNQAQKLLDPIVQDNCNEQLSSPIIWRLLLWITRVRHEIDPVKYPLSNVKTIFYRACQDNPGAKVFFLDTMNYCESATKTDIIDMKGKYIRKKYRNTAKAVLETQLELQHLMTEKEIHVRIPMEELQVMLEPEDID